MGNREQRIETAPVEKGAASNSGGRAMDNKTSNGQTAGMAPNGQAANTTFSGQAAGTARGGQVAKAGTKAMLILLLVANFSTSISQSMMNIALPEVADKFGVSLSIANWIVVGYTIVAATMITMAPSILRRIGLRKLFTVACGSLALGSIIGMFAFDFPVLIVARLVQAVSTGLLFPAVSGVIMEVVERRHVGTVLAINTAIIAVGLAVSPVVSGLLLTYVNLHAMFVVTAILGIALIVVGARLLVDVFDREHKPIDPLSVCLSFAGLAALMYGLGEVSHDPFPSIIAMVVGAIILALFVWRQTRLKVPLLNLKPLRNPRFAVGIVLVMFGFMGAAAMNLLLPLYYEGRAGETAFMAGVLLLGPVIVDATFAVIGGKIYDKRGIWPLVPIGFAMILAGLASIFFAAEHMLIVAVVLLSALVYGGVGFSVAPPKTVALAQLPSDLYADGAAINSTFVQVASSIGSALFVGVLSGDVIRDMAAGMAKADAYAAGFSHTIIISVGIAVVALVVAIIYARKMRKPHSSQ